MKPDQSISTPPKPGVTAARMVAARKGFDHARLLVLRDRLPWFWFAFTVAVLLLSAMDCYHIIIDPAGTCYVSPLLQFKEARQLHVQQAELATSAFLERNPKDFDNPGLLKLLFLKNAFTKAQDERISEAVEFRAKQLHQKAEIGRIDILGTRENEVLAAVTGQIIRSGIFTASAPAFSRNAPTSPPSSPAATIGRIGPRKPLPSSRSSSPSKNRPTSNGWPTNWKPGWASSAIGNRWPPAPEPIFPISSASPNLAPKPADAGNAHALMNSGNTIPPSTNGGPPRSRPCC